MQYIALINRKETGKHFTKSEKSSMNVVWNAFNKYAKARGYTIPVTGNYFGGMAWQNPDSLEVMELVKA